MGGCGCVVRMVVNRAQRAGAHRVPGTSRIAVCTNNSRSGHNAARWKGGKKKGPTLVGPPQKHFYRHATGRHAGAHHRREVVGQVAGALLCRLHRVNGEGACFKGEQRTQRLCQVAVVAGWQCGLAVGMTSRVCMALMACGDVAGSVVGGVRSCHVGIPTTVQHSAAATCPCIYSSSNVSMHGTQSMLCDPFSLYGVHPHPLHMAATTCTSIKHTRLGARPRACYSQPPPLAALRWAPRAAPHATPPR